MPVRPTQAHKPSATFDQWQRPTILAVKRRPACPHGIEVAHQERLLLLPHGPEVVLGVLVEVFCLDDLAAASRIFGKVGVPLVVVAGVGRGLARIAWRPDARRSRMRRSLLILIACGLNGRLRGPWSKGVSSDDREWPSVGDSRLGCLGQHRGARGSRARRQSGDGISSWCYCQFPCVHAPFNLGGPTAHCNWSPQSRAPVVSSPGTSYGEPARRLAAVRRANLAIGGTS